MQDIGAEYGVDVSGTYPNHPEYESSRQALTIGDAQLDGAL
jgi:hypothetical protein